MKYIIYTDGSHLKRTTGRLGIGGVLLDEAEDNVLEKFSEEIETGWLEKNYGTSDVSNPTCEMLATLWALREFGKKFKPGDEVVMKSDYTGCKYFNEGQWRAKLPYIIQLRDETKAEISKLKIKVSFEWVKGHQAKSVKSKDAYWNNFVDLLAKGL